MPNRYYIGSREISKEDFDRQQNCNKQDVNWFKTLVRDYKKQNPKGRNNINRYRISTKELLCRIIEEALNPSQIMFDVILNENGDVVENIFDVTTADEYGGWLEVAHNVKPEQVEKIKENYLKQMELKRETLYLLLEGMLTIRYGFKKPETNNCDALESIKKIFKL